jgi:hypothetical protein
MSRNINNYTNITNNYEKISADKEDIDKYKDKYYIIQNKIDKNKKVDNRKNYQLIFVIIILIILLVSALKFNFNNELKNRIKILPLILIILFFLIYMMDKFYISVERFTEFDLKLKYKSNNYFEKVANSNINDLNPINKDKYYLIKTDDNEQYPDIYLLKSDLEKDTQDRYNYNSTLIHYVYKDDKKTGDGKKYIKKQAEYILNNDDIFKVQLNESITIRSINKNLINEEIKSEALRNRGNNLVLKTNEYNGTVVKSILNKSDLIYLLIYIGLILLLWNICVIDFGFKYNDRLLVGIIGLLLLSGIYLYLHRNVIIVHTDTNKKYFR